MKFLMMGVMALLLLGAGGAGGYFFFKQSAVASLGESSQEAIQKKAAKKSEAQSKTEESFTLRFVEMDPIILPIIDTNGVNQVVTLIVSVEVSGEENASLVRRLSPRLKDAYIQDMYGVLNRKASMEGGVIKVDQLKSRLNRVSDKVLGDKVVNSVLLQVVNQRPI